MAFVETRTNPTNLPDKELESPVPYVPSGPFANSFALPDSPNNDVRDNKTAHF
jgi:hypothetical protein